MFVRLLSLVGGLCCLLLASAANAQSRGFSIDRFDVAERGSDWFVGESLDMRGHGRGAIGLTVDYAFKPLVFYDLDGNEKSVIVRHQAFVHVGGSVVLWDRLRLSANVPIAARTVGEHARIGLENIDPTTGTSLGDVRLGADVRLVGVYGGPAELALGVQFYLPTGDRESFTGDGKLRIMPRLMLAGEIGPFAYSGRAALAWRGQDDALGGVPVGSEVFFAATAGFWVAKRKVLFGPELWGSTVIENDGAFKKPTTPFELILGIHFRPKDWRFGIGGGPGLTRGLGAPNYRLLATAEWAPEAKPADRDHDGVIDPEDACPDIPGPRSNDPKKNGCPVSDRDRDGILDEDDACPDLYGAPNPDPRLNGCPPPGDRDGDGIADNVDACPDVPGEPNENPALNGCPMDSDGDGIIDREDACPKVPGLRNADPAKNGCPLAALEGREIKIYERVEFKTDSAQILPVSDTLLTAVREIINGHPELKNISVEGHTDNVGGASYNEGLSRRRAASVVAWLIGHGVDPDRMSSVGYGLRRPLDTNNTPAGRQRNRRVEFHILDGAGPSAEDTTP